MKKCSTIYDSYFLDKMDISREGLRILGDEEPSLFCTWEFFEFEIQSTPVVKSAK